MTHLLDQADERAELDGEEYDDYLAVAGVACICLTCGERSTVDPHNLDSSRYRMLCGACGKHIMVEDEISPETWGILLCKRMGHHGCIAKDTTGHEWHFEREAV
jgi:hypothetical protein